MPLFQRNNRGGRTHFSSKVINLGEYLIYGQRGIRRSRRVLWYRNKVGKICYEQKRSAVSQRRMP